MQNGKLLPTPFVMRNLWSYNYLHTYPSGAVTLQSLNHHNRVGTYIVEYIFFLNQTIINIRLWLDSALPVLDARLTVQFFNA